MFSQRPFDEMLGSATTTSFPSNVSNSSQQRSFAPSTRLTSYDSVHITPSQLHESPINNQNQSFQEDANLSNIEENAISRMEVNSMRDNINIQLSNSNQSQIPTTGSSGNDCVPTPGSSLRQEVPNNDDSDPAQRCNVLPVPSDGGSHRSSVTETDICEHD